MKPKSKLLSLLLAICLVVGLMPTAAFAAGTDTGKAIQLVDSETAANISGGQGSNIYFGTYQQSSDGNSGYNTDPIKWRVLKNANGQLFLLSDQNLDVFQYHVDYENVTWATSTMRSWLNGYGAAQNTGSDNGIDYTDDNFIDTAFSDGEQGAIADTTVVNDDNPDYNIEGGENTTDKIFLLSIDEASTGSYFADNNSRIATNTAYVADGGKIDGGMYGVGAADYWWLRSPGFDNINAAYVNSYGGVISDGGYVYSGDDAVRPAFNLDLTSVLFTSAAEGGKSSGTVGADALTKIADYSGSEWKLTLLDESRSSFAVGTTAVNGDKLTVAYEGAATGNNEYISAVVMNANNEIVYYGRLKNTDSSGDASGTVEVTLPDGFNSGSDKLYVFSEQCNGDKKTDYASELKQVSLTKNVYAVSNNLTNLTTDNTSKVIKADGDYTATLSASGDYVLPESVTVKIGDTVLAASESTYTYNNTTGELVIKAVGITDDITITATGVLSAIGAPSVSSNAAGWTNQDVTLTASGSYSLSGIARYEYSTDGGKNWTAMTPTKQTAASSTAPANVEEAQLTISEATDTEYLIRAVSNTGAYSDNVSVTVKIETTAPVIAGITNGETYCPNQTFTVTEAHLKEVTINNVKVQAENGVYTLTTEGNCTIVATDEAGNSVTCTVTVGHIWNTKISYQWSKDGKSCTAIRTCTKDSTHMQTATATNITSEVTTQPTCTEMGETTYTATFDVDWAQKQITERTDIPATGHTYVYHEAVSAECEQPGMKAYYTCENCNLIFDENYQVTTLDDLTIDATGHTFLTEWKTNVENHWHECSCGERTEEAAHTFEWKVDKEAEVGIAGEKHEECTVCSYAKAAVEIPALKAPEYPPVVDDTDGGKVTVTPENPQEGDKVTITTKPEDGKEVEKVVVTDENGKEITVTDNGDGTYTFVQPDGKVTVKVTFKAEETKPVTDDKSPQTGDNSDITLWLAVMLMGGVGVVSITVCSRKKRKYSK